jgi:hypothetical protein
MPTPSNHSKNKKGRTTTQWQTRMTPILPTPSSHPAPRPTEREERKKRKNEKRKKKVNHPFIAHSLSTLVYHLTH